MKKIFIGIIIFGVLSFAITGVLIKKDIKEGNKESVPQGSSVEYVVQENNGEHVVKEKTLDLYGRFNENDIELKRVEVQFDKVSGEISVPQISGLKDKTIEEKVNDDIKETIKAKIDELSSNNSGELIIDGNEFYPYTGGSSCANFSNVLSFRANLFYKINGNETSYTYDSIYFNYELVNGTKLKFEDLFTKDADLYNIVRKGFYRILAADAIWNVEQVYDEEKGEWINVPRVPNVTENDINKKINKFINNSYEPFYFTPQRVYLDKDYSACIEFKDIANEVTIYDKYLTGESIYERNDIGLKNLWTCVIPCRESISFQEYGFLEDNLYYDITKDYFPDEDYYKDYAYNNYLESIDEATLKNARKQVEEYRNIAKENPDKFYVLFVSTGADAVAISKYDNESNKINYKHSNIITSGTTINLLIASGENAKENTMKDLLEKYRYYNIGFYNSRVIYLYDSEAFAETKVETKMYNAKTQKEITSIGELFKDGVDYEEILNSKLKEELEAMNMANTPEKLKTNMQEAKFYISSGSIYAQIPDYEYPVNLLWIDQNDVEELLNIYD